MRQIIRQCRPESSVILSYTSRLALFPGLRPSFCRLQRFFSMLRKKLRVERGYLQVAGLLKSSGMIIICIKKIKPETIKGCFYSLPEWPVHCKNMWVVLNQLDYHSCNFKGEKQLSCFCIVHAHNLSFKINPHVIVECIHKNVRVVFDP